jgi:hypothetical protein
MRAVRWILVLLHLTLVGGLSANLLISGDVWAWIVVGVTLFALALFILGAGHKDLFRPIGRPRILFPVVSASLMLTALLGGLTFALAELFRMDVDDETWVVASFWGSLLVTWFFWAIVLYAYTLLRSFWGYWPVAALAAWGILLLVVALILTRPWIMLAALLSAFAGLIYTVSWTGFWDGFVVLVIPTGLMGIVLMKLVMGGPIPRPAARLDADGPAD